MIKKLWKDLSSPQLVYKIQNYFGLERTDGKKDEKFIIKNKFFYYLFLIGTELGKSSLKNFIS